MEILCNKSNRKVWTKNIHRALKALFKSMLLFLIYGEKKKSVIVGINVVRNTYFVSSKDGSINGCMQNVKST